MIPTSICAAQLLSVSVIWHISVIGISQSLHMNLPLMLRPPYLCLLAFHLNMTRIRWQACSEIGLMTRWCLLKLTLPAAIWPAHEAKMPYRTNRELHVNWAPEDKKAECHHYCVILKQHRAFPGIWPQKVFQAINRSDVRQRPSSVLVIVRSWLRTQRVLEEEGKQMRSHPLWGLPSPTGWGVYVSRPVRIGWGQCDRAHSGQTITLFHIHFLAWREYFASRSWAYSKDGWREVAGLHTAEALQVTDGCVLDPCVDWSQPWP